MRQLDCVWVTGMSLEINSFGKLKQLSKPGFLVEKGRLVDSQPLPPTPLPMGEGGKSQKRSRLAQLARSLRCRRLRFYPTNGTESPSPAKRRDRGEGRRRRSAVLFAIPLLILLSLFFQRFPVLAQSPIQVGLVVQYAPGNVVTQCVTLSKPNPSGWDVLAAANLGVVGSASGMGMAVCAIGGLGCPPTDCFCKFNSGENLYWSYWHSKGSGWVYSNLGASNYIVSPREVEGWIWGDGRTPPPLISFEQICAAPATATHTFTPLPTSTVTFTPLPTATFTLTPLPQATTAPVINPSPTLPAPTVISMNSPTPLPATVTQPLQAPLRTPALTPSPTITLPFGAALAAITVVPTHDPSQAPTNPPTEIAFDLQAISLTATAVEAARQAESLPNQAQQSEETGMNSLGFSTSGIAYGIFFVMAAGLLLVLVLLVRRRGRA